MKKIILPLFLSACICVSAFAENDPEYKFIVVDNTSIPITGISHNQKYVFGNNTGGRCMVIDTDTEETQIIFPTQDVDFIYSVTNDGTAIGRCGAEALDYPAYRPWGGEWTPFEGIGEDVTKAVLSASADGAILGGYTQHPEINNLYVPCIWTVGAEGAYQEELLPYPEKDFFGNQPQWCRVDQISADGNILMGIYVPNMGLTEAYHVVWRKTAGGYELDKVGEALQYDYETNEPRVNDGIEVAISRLSENAKYITTAKSYLEINGLEFKRYHYPLIINLENKENPYTILVDPNYGEVDPFQGTGDQVWGIQTIDDGTTFAANPYRSAHWPASGLVYNSATSSYTLYEGWIKEKTGIDIFEKTNLTSSGSPLVSGNSELITGSYTDAGDGSIHSYYIKKIDNTSINSNGQDQVRAYFSGNKLHLNGNFTKASITDLTGKIIYENITEEEVSVSVPNGVYIISLTTTDGIIQTMKVAK